jgi:hypothetical protein
MAPSTPPFFKVEFPKKGTFSVFIESMTRINRFIKGFIVEDFAIYLDMWSKTENKHDFALM